MASLTTLPLPEVSPEVYAFAEKAGVADYLPAVLAMTRRIFPTWPLRVYLEDDPEIADERYIVLELQMPDEVKVDCAVELHWQWSGEIFRHCPSPYAYFFSLRMV